MPGWPRMARRFVRLVLPYAVALVVAILVQAAVRPWFAHDSVSAEPGLWQLLAHALLLQGVLGEESLSAGVWYVAIDFQLFVLTTMLLAGATTAATRLRVAVTPTFSRQLLLPRLALFRHAYPDIELILQVTIPVANVTAEDADLELRFGTGPFADRESMHLLSDDVCPVCSPEYLSAAGPFDDGFETQESIVRAHLIRTPLEPWRTWFRACGVALPEPASGSQFNDLGLVLDAAVAGFGVALMRLKLGRSWLDSGRLLRLSPRSVRSPHDYFLCWKPGALQRWECAAFVDWLRQALR